MAITALCTSADLANRAAVLGVNLRVDDDPTTAAWACRRGSLDVYSYAVPRYTPAQLQASDAATEYAADCGLYHLCRRRMNPVPKSVIDIYAEMKQTLLLIQAGKISIFDIVPVRENAPAMSNITTMLEPWPHSTVERQQSTGSPPEGYRQRRPFDDGYAPLP